MVDPKYGGLGHTGKGVLIFGTTISSMVLLLTATALGFSKETRTLHVPGGVLDARTTSVKEVDATLQERAGVEHTIAVHVLVNFRKFCPNMVIMLPGKVFAGLTPPKLLFVTALATMTTPSIIRTDISFVDCRNITSMVQFPVGIVEFSIKTTSFNDSTVHATGYEHN